MSIELVMPSNHLILCYPLLLLSSIFASIRVFSNESALCIMWPKYWSFSFSISPSNSVQFSSVAQLCPTLCNPVDRSTPGLPVYHQLPEFTQIHVHWVGDAIQPSHPLSSPSPPAFNLPRIRVFSKESVLHIRWPKYWSFSFSISPSNEYSGLILGWTSWISLQSKGLSRIYSNTTVHKYQLFGAQLYSPTHTSIYDYWQNYSFY